MKKVYVIILNWNGWRDTVECLESLIRCSYKNFRIVVCDNASRDGSLEQIKAWAEGRLLVDIASENPMHRFSWPPVTKPLSIVEYSRSQAELGGDNSVDPPLVLIDTGANLGFAGGNNVGIRYALARGDFSHVWLLNNDTVADAEALTALMQRMEEKPAAGMCGSALFYYDKPDKVQALGGGWHCKWVGFPWHYGRFNGHYDPENPMPAESWMNYVEGASMLVSKEFLLDIGLMCEDYFLFFEETDWAIRANGKYTLAYAPESVVYHKVGGSIGTSSVPSAKSFVCDFYSVRNRLLFTRRFYPYALPSIYMILLLTIMAKIILMQFDRLLILLKMLFCSNLELASLRHEQ